MTSLKPSYLGALNTRFKESCWVKAQHDFFEIEVYPKHE
jgi:hypothetical protein